MSRRPTTPGGKYARRFETAEDVQEWIDLVPQRIAALQQRMDFTVDYSEESCNQLFHWLFDNFDDEKALLAEPAHVTIEQFASYKGEYLIHHLPGSQWHIWIDEGGNQSVNWPLVRTPDGGTSSAIYNAAIYDVSRRRGVDVGTLYQETFEKIRQRPIKPLDDTPPKPILTQTMRSLTYTPTTINPDQLDKALTKNLGTTNRKPNGETTHKTDTHTITIYPTDPNSDEAQGRFQELLNNPKHAQGTTPTPDSTYQQVWIVTCHNNDPMDGFNDWASAINTIETLAPGYTTYNTGP